MRYNLKEYYPEFSVDFKIIKKNYAQKSFVKYIFNVLNQRKYNDIEAFYSQNSNFQQFLMNYINYNKRVNEISTINPNTLNLHFSQTLSEDDYQLIIKNIFKLSEKKMSFNEKKLKAITSVDEEVSPYINTKNESFNFIPIKELISKLDDLDEEERKFVFQVVSNLQDIENIRVDLQKRVYIDSNGKMLMIKGIVDKDKKNVGLDIIKPKERTDEYQKKLTYVSEKDMAA